MYGGHASQQRWHQGGQVRCSRTKRSLCPLTHLPTQSVICLSEPAQRLLFFSLSGNEHDCALLALREIKAVMWLCHGKTTKKSCPISTLVENLHDNVKERVQNFLSRQLFCFFMILWALFFNATPYCKMHVHRSTFVCYFWLATEHLRVSEV